MKYIGFPPLKYNLYPLTFCCQKTRQLNCQDGPFSESYLDIIIFSLPYPTDLIRLEEQFIQRHKSNNLRTSQVFLIQEYH